MIEWIQAHWKDILAILGALWGVATTIAMMTPTDKDDTWLEKIGKWADKIGIKLKGK